MYIYGHTGGVGDFDEFSCLLLPKVLCAVVGFVLRVFGVMFYVWVSRCHTFNSKPHALRRSVLFSHLCLGHPEL